MFKKTKRLAAAASVAAARDTRIKRGPHASHSHGGCIHGGRFGVPFSVSNLVNR
jgi:hypothetical protein